MMSRQRKDAMGRHTMDDTSPQIFTVCSHRRPGDSPTPENAMETRISRLEVAIEYIQRDLGDLKKDMRSMRCHIKTDFRILFGTITAVAIGLASLMAKGFQWL